MNHWSSGNCLRSQVKINLFGKERLSNGRICEIRTRFIWMRKNKHSRTSDYLDGKRLGKSSLIKGVILYFNVYMLYACVGHAP